MIDPEPFAFVYLGTVHDPTTHIVPNWNILHCFTLVFVAFPFPFPQSASQQQKTNIFPLLFL